MKFIDVLRKLGIIRGGVVSGTYKSYKDMPDELMNGNVYDKEKDLVGGQSKSKKTSFGLTWVFWLFIIVSVLVSLFLLMMLGLVIWFYLCLLFWLFFIYKLFGYKNGTATILNIAAYFMFVLIISVIFLFIFTDGSKSASGDCSTLAKQYNGKVLTVSSPDKLKGEIGIKVDGKTCDYEITWHTLFESSKIIKNVANANSPISSYDYIADIVFAKEGSSPADGNIDPVFANKDKLPVDPFNIRVPYDFYSTKELIAGTDKTAITQNFHHVMQSTGTFSQSSIDAALGVKMIRIYTRTAGVSGSPIAEFNVVVSK